MERYAGTEYCCKHNLLIKHLRRGYSKRSGNINRLVAHTFRHLVGHDFTYTLKITAETQHVGLHIDIAQFTHILTHQRRCFGKIDYFHDSIKVWDYLCLQRQN